METNQYQEQIRINRARLNHPDTIYEQMRMNRASEKSKKSIIVVGFIISKAHGECLPFGDPVYTATLTGMAHLVEQRIEKAER